MLDVSLSLFSVQHRCVLSVTFLSPLTSISDYVIMMCIVCHVDILCLSVCYNRVIWFLSFLSLGTMQNQNMRESMSYTIKRFKNTFAINRDPGIKCILPLFTTSHQNDDARYKKNTSSWDQNVNTYKIFLTEFTAMTNY